MVKLDFEFVQEPFPHVIIDDFLNEELLVKLNEEFPRHLLKNSEMSGRMKIHKSELIPRMKEVSGSWNEFLSILDSELFVYTLLKKAKAFLLEDTKINFNNPIRMNKVNRFSPDYNEFYLDYDISEAGVGYHREIHHDNNNRLISFLYHLNDCDITGGNLDLYSTNKDTIYRKQYPLNVNHFAEVEHRKNRMVLFVSNKRSFHSVQKITDCNIPRRFLYGAITHCGKGVWK